LAGPDRAARLFAVAERTALAITDEMNEDKAEASARANAFSHSAPALAVPIALPVDGVLAPRAGCVGARFALY
jgi:hypothetical protein